MKTDTVCVGEGLTQVYQQATAGLRQGEEVSRTICDINGERYRNVEFPYAILRVHQPFVDAGAYDSPADCWGDVGAASGPLFALLAIAAAQRGYAKGPHTLIWCSSEGGARAGALLRCE